MNLFGKDTFTVDDELPFNLNSFLAQIFSLAGAVGLLLYSFPIMAPALSFVVYLFYRLQVFYRLSSRAVKRYLTLNRSSVYQQLSQLLAHGPVIRAQLLVPFLYRPFCIALDEDVRLNLNQSLMSLWLIIRLRLLGVLMVGTLAIAIVIVKVLSQKGIISYISFEPQLMGLAIASSLTVVHILSGIFSNFALIEQDAVSIECLHSFTNSEDGSLLVQVDAPASLSCDTSTTVRSGDIAMENVSVQYSDSVVLSEININLPQGNRVAVIGRTGQ